jgi:anaerobic nitric oxide reductase transcription regulator
MEHQLFLELLESFADTSARRIGVASVRLDAIAKARLTESEWPGNVRELENLIARAALRAAATTAGSPLSQETVTIALTHLDLTPARDADRPADRQSPRLAASDPAASFRDQVAEFERRVISDAIARHHGNWAAAAARVGHASQQPASSRATPRSARTRLIDSQLISWVSR